MGWPFIIIKEGEREIDFRNSGLYWERRIKDKMLHFRVKSDVREPFWVIWQVLTSFDKFWQVSAKMHFQVCQLLDILESP